MQIRQAFGIALACLAWIAPQAGAHAAPQNQEPQKASEGMRVTLRKIAPSSVPTEANPALNETIQRVFQREGEEDGVITKLAPVVETYIQVEKSDKVTGIRPDHDFYFLGVADFSGKDMQVRPMTVKTHKGSMLWSFAPSGFLQTAFVDYGGFNNQNYKLTPAGRTFLGEVRCFIFDVEPLPGVKGARFRGRIWVEDQDFTIVRINGGYAPEHRLSLKHFEEEYYLHFDSWRTNVKSGFWMPSDIFTQEISEPVPSGGPRFKGRTHIWGYGLTTLNHEEELGRLVVETEGQVKDEAAAPDRSPLDQQRKWRELSENNVMDVLERVGLVAPKGDVEKVLDTIVNNIMVTNNFDNRIDLHCRVLMTSDFEMFSMQNTIVLSRGLIDVVPNEETLATMLAFEMADALEPKSAEDQYGFSDVLRLTPTQVLKKMTFVDTREEAQKNGEKALAWLRNSPYKDRLANAGLFLSQLQSQKSALKELIGARLGNRIYLTSQLLQSAPALDSKNLQQTGALPMGSRIKIDPWSDSVMLLKTQQMPPFSPREKIPFEVTPIDLHLTRYPQTSADGEHSIIPRSAMPTDESAKQN
jgi:hypothetical protein